MFPHVDRPFVPPQFGIKRETEAWERAESARLRRDVFCTEQRIFAHDDRDAIDETALAIVAVDYVMGMAHRVVGTVRVHAAGANVWYGSRLAIDARYRNVYGLGSGLVHRAVSTAIARGCATFLAHVQRENVPFFRRLAWDALDDLMLHGRPHVLMRADLDAYGGSESDDAVSVIRARAS